MSSLLKTNEVGRAIDTETQERVRLAAQIFDKYGDMIHSMICSRVDNKSMIDDISQDLFLSLVRKPIPSDVQNIEGYLSRAVKNDVIDAAGREESYQARNRAYAGQYSSRVPYDDPQNIIVQSEEIQRLFELVEKKLFPHEAKAVIQRYKYDRDIGNAADEMGVNKRSFSRYLCTGLKKIRVFIYESKK